MKFTSLVLFSLLTGLMNTNLSNAQSFSIGPKVGYNSAKLSGNSLENFHNNSSLNGMHLGLFAEARFSKFAIQPEILYSTVGGSIDIEMNDATIQHNLDLNYINIPVIFKYYLTNSIAIEAGPQFGFLTNTDAKLEDFSLMDKTLNDLDISANAGISINLPLSLMVSVRYNVGFTDVANDFNANWKNRMLQLALGYRF